MTTADAQTSPQLALPTEPTGLSIVAGRPVEASNASTDPELFRAHHPGTGRRPGPEFACAKAAEIDDACKAAWEAFHANQSFTNEDRARLLESIAENIESLGSALVECASNETGFSTVRITAERERTCAVLRMFAATVREGGWVRAVIDRGHPSRRPVPKPDVRSMLRPLGPVAVFGASSFPLACSTAGGDTASALAAGCPVIVKGHPSHPGAGELIAHAVAKAVLDHGFHAGTFSFLHAGGVREKLIGERIVRSDYIRAVGFTGSVQGGMAIEDIARSRPDPIPVFAAMGSVNPVFLLPHALRQDTQALADRIFSSITNSNGQMCTCPGLLFMERSDESEAFLRALAERMNNAEPHPMLSDRTRKQLNERLVALNAIEGVDLRAGSPQGAHSGRNDGPVYASAALFRTGFGAFKDNTELHEEVFGPISVAVVCADEDELMKAAALFQGSLTGSIFAGGYDAAAAGQLRSILEQRVGRVVFNSVPTGVEVCSAMVHGGPFPATSAAHTTAVGPRALERWARPVAYQNAPAGLLPPELRDDNPLRIRRLVDDQWVSPKG